MKTKFHTLKKSNQFMHTSNVVSPKPQADPLPHTHQNLVTNNVQGIIHTLLMKYKCNIQVYVK